MTHRWHEIAFTPAVRRLQDADGSRASYADATERRGPNDRFTPREAEFIAARDGFYVASVSETGWPCAIPRRAGGVRTRRGRGDPGLGRLPRQPATRHGRQRGRGRPRRALLHGLREPSAAEALRPPALRARRGRPGSRRFARGAGLRGERAALIVLAGFDWNCPQHIPRRYTPEDLARALAPLHATVGALRLDAHAD